MIRLLLAGAILGAALLASPAAHADVLAHIDLSDQRMDVYVDGFKRYSWPVSTARRGYRTPVGTYRPTRMHEMWYSRKYDMSPMPHSIFFKGGYAVHGTTEVKYLGRPASHGCVRLHPDNARRLYQLVKSQGSKATRITITQ
ncbi:MAG: L,D-transpeptidase [Flavobacteriaceae bacterium]